jgi:hypothetical protein
LRHIFFLSEYFRFLATIDKPYIMPYESAQFSKIRPQTGYNSHYNEEKGDACYARMLGTYEENGRQVTYIYIYNCLNNFLDFYDWRTYFVYCAVYTLLRLFFIITKLLDYFNLVYVI